MTRTRIKFCGITRAEDAAVAADLGVDAIGLVFVPGSKRQVDLAGAEAILARLPAFVASVALFMDAAEAEVQACLRRLPFDLLQFHGSEAPEYCASFGRPWLKALPMGEDMHLQSTMDRYARARAILLDAHRPGEQGGLGEVFDWRRIPAEVAGRIVLAGGLDPANVAAAVRQVGPYAVDVSSGIESAPGRKCPRRMELFIKEVQGAGRERQAG